MQAAKHHQPLSFAHPLRTMPIRPHAVGDRMFRILPFAVVPLLAFTAVAQGQAQQNPSACAHPAVAPGQEALISAMLSPTDLPADVTVGDQKILADHLEAEFIARPKIGPEVRIVYALYPITAARHDAFKTDRFDGTHRQPCAENPTMDGPALAELRKRHGCPLDNELINTLERSLQNAIKQQESKIVWACPASVDAAQPNDWAKQLREIDAMLSVADLPKAKAKWQALLAQFPLDKANFEQQVDAAAMLQKLGMANEAKLQLLAAEKAAPSALWTPIRPEQIAQVERIAALYAALGNAKKADELLQNCWKDLPNQPTCHSAAMADLLERFGHADLAAAALDRELKRNVVAPIEIYRVRISLASRMNDAKAEIAVSLEGIAKYPNDVQMQDSLGTAYFRDGQHALAVSQFEKVYKLDEKFPGVLARLSGAFNDMGNGDKPEWQALRQKMQDRAAKDPNDIVAVFLKAVAHFYAGEFEQAIATMKLVEPHAPNEARVYIYEAMAHFWLGHQAEAETLVERARTANPYDSDVYYCYSQIIRKKDLPAAIASMERYLTLASAPGALQFAKKTKRVQDELDMMRKGEIPPPLDMPGHDKPKKELDNPMAITSDWLWVGGAFAIWMAGAFWFVRRRKKVS